MNKICVDVDAAVARALNFESKLPPDTLALEGYSGYKGRHLLNNLAAVFTPYVEVGCFWGSTLICAAYKNEGLIVGVDNFTDETKPGHYMLASRQRLLRTLEAYSDIARPSLIDASCWNVPLSGFKCCFFDGGHTEQEHADSLIRLAPWFTDCFVFVVDDYNRQNVRDGTQRGIEMAKLKVESFTGVGGMGTDDKEGWWNGMGIFVLSKQ